METKHTKGEWKIFPIKASHATQIINSEQQCIATANNYNGSARQMEANAKLIAAAPELLEALIEINGLIADASNVENGKVNLGELAKISINAIKKATT